MTPIWEHAFNHSTLNEVLDVLTLRQFYRETNTEPASKRDIKAIDLPSVKLEQAAFIASILSASPKEEHKQKALAFAILAYLDNKNAQYASYCYVILSRTNNIQQGEHLPELFTKGTNLFKIKFDEMLNLELGVARELSYLQVVDRELFLSAFQKNCG